MKNVELIIQSITETDDNKTIEFICDTIIKYKYTLSCLTELMNNPLIKESDDYQLAFSCALMYLDTKLPIRKIAFQIDGSTILRIDGPKNANALNYIVDLTQINKIIMIDSINNKKITYSLSSCITLIIICYAFYKLIF